MLVAAQDNVKVLRFSVTVQAGRLGNSEAGLSLRRRDAIAAER